MSLCLHLGCLTPDTVPSFSADSVPIPEPRRLLCVATGCLQGAGAVGQGPHTECLRTAVLGEPACAFTLCLFLPRLAVTSAAVRSPSCCHVLLCFTPNCQNDGLRVDLPLLRSQVCGLYDSHFPHRRHFFLFYLQVLDG